MISVSDNQLRIVAEAANRLPAEARGTFLRRVVAEVREGQSFNDSDIERAVRVALLDQSMKQAPVSSTDQGAGKRRSVIDAAHAPLRSSKSWRMVRPSGQGHREHEGAGRPIRTMSRELELLSGRLCDLPGCAESANP
jgi:hypothetical protein